MFQLLIAGAAAGMQAYSAYQQYKSQEDMAEYNAKVAEEEARAAQQAIDAELGKMTFTQRQIKAKNRMDVAARGGSHEGSDLMMEAEVARLQQLESLELMRQKDLAGIRGASEAAMSRYQGKQARAKGRWTVATSLMGGVSTYSSLGGKMYLGDNVGKG